MYISSEKVRSILCAFLLCLCGIGYGQVFTTEIISEKSTFVSTEIQMSPPEVSPNLNVGNTRLAKFPSGYTIVTYRSLIELNLSLIPSNAVILSAQLKVRQASGTGTPEIITGRAGTSWNESIVWSTQPAIQTSDQISVYTMNGSWMLVDVKEHVQKMVAGIYPNNGWILKGSTDVEANPVSANKVFYSDNHTTPSERPRLEVSYYIPMSVSGATIGHTSSSVAQNGSVQPVLSDGPGGTYSYQWYNKNGIMSGKTALNLTGIPYGWYGVRVTSSIAGTDPFYYAFLVGINCESVEIEFNPGPNYIDDAVVTRSSMFGSTYEITNYHTSRTLDLFSSGFVTSRSVLRFRLWLDDQLHINQAMMGLMASSVQYEAAIPNNGVMYMGIRDWNEKTVTYSNQPTYSTSNPIQIPVLTSAPQYRQLDVLESFNFWKEHNNQNFGWLMKLNTENVSTTISQIYHSSDAALISNHPKVVFNIGSANPVAPGYCNQSFAKTDRTLRGVRYKPYMGHLYFYYEEEYNTSGQGLNYRVYRDDNPITAVLNHSIQPLTEIEYGDNRYVLRTASLPVGFYVLEITNDKQEKFYLRFKIEN